MTEADTCRELVTPMLTAAGWGTSESVIGEQHSFTNGRILKIGGASPGGAGRNRTLGLEKLMAIEVPLPPSPVQQTFDRLQAGVSALKAQHAAIRKANAALVPATLERIFHTEVKA